MRGVKKPSFVSGKTGVDYLVKKKCRTNKFFTIFMTQLSHGRILGDIVECGWWEKNGKFMLK